MSSKKKEKIWSEKYIFDEADNDREVRECAEALGVSEVFAVLLRNRGYRTADEARRFLHFETADFHNPFLLNDIEKAVDRIMEAVAKGEKICVYGDYDVDGVTSVSMLLVLLQLQQARSIFPR